jgi:capsular polysaccharide biosynthesis protein
MSLTKTIIREILPNEVVFRPLPINLKTSDRSLFEHESIKIIKPCFEIFCNNALITKKGHVFCNNRLLLESNSGEDNYFTQLYWNFELEVVPNNSIICCLFTAWSENYYHWFCDVLPKFMYLKQKGTLYNYVYYFPDFLNKSFIIETLQLLNVSYAFFDYSKLLFAKRLYFISLTADIGSYRPSFQQLTQSFFIEKLCFNQLQNLSNKKVFISRKKALCRKIVNENEIESILLALGFECYVLEDMSFVQQVQLMHQTKILIANHGAGLTNMLFLNEASIVLELRQENDALNNCYFSLAAALQYKYYYLLCKSMQTNDFDSDVVVDASNFKKIVEAIIEQL